MRILVDTNVVLDVLLARAPHADAAARLLSLIDRGRIEGVLCATTVTTVHCLATKALGRRKAKSQVRQLIAMFEIAPVDRAVLSLALDLDFSDYEDAVLHESARAAAANAIVTRNGIDFANATLPVFSPPELLASILGTES